MDAKELENRVARLEKALSDFAAELHYALDYIQGDVHSSLTKSRTVMEKLLARLYLKEMGREPRKPLLGDMLADTQFNKKISRRILSRMNAIRDLGNLGPHGEPVKPSDAARVLEDLCEVLEWYLESHPEIPLAATPSSPGVASQAVATPDSPESLYQLGCAYTAGVPGKQNDAEAAKCFRKAAERGHADAQYLLGHAYDTGRGVAQDFTQAILWYRKAADQGLAEAQYALGTILFDGRGWPVNYPEALVWFNQAATQGHTAAQMKIGTMYYNGLGVPHDHQQARTWYKKAVDSAKPGDPLKPRALGMLAFLYLGGFSGTPVDTAAARECTRQAADLGDADSQYAYGVWLATGDGVRKDTQKAADYWRLAADQGHAKALEELKRLVR